MAIGWFAFDTRRCTDAACIETNFTPFYFFSKFPDKVTPIWNLIRLFPPLIWGLTFISIVLVAAFHFLASKIYAKMGLEKSLIHMEVKMMPTRYKESISSNQFILLTLLG